LHWADVDEPIARRAGELGRRHRRSHPGLALADLPIAAIALVEGVRFAWTAVTVEGSTWRPVVWIDCRSVPQP